MKLKIKLNLSILSAVFVLFIISTYLIFRSTKTWAEKSAEELLKNKSIASSIQVKSFFEDAINKTYALNDVVAALKSNPKTTRQEYRKTVKSALEKNPNYLSVWIQFEANSMDTLDNSYKDSADYGSHGRFQHSFYKSNGQILIQTTPKEQNEDDQYSEDYYAVPKKADALTIVEPYFYDYVGDGKETFFETSIAIPYHNTNKQFIGVIGVDLDLSPLQTIYKDVKMFESGYCQLISNSGIVVTDHEGKNIGLHHSDSLNREAMNAISEGKSFTYNSSDMQTGVDYIINYTPIYFGASKQPWTLRFKVPKSEAMAEANAILTSIIIIELISMLLLGIVVYILADSIVKPLIRSIDIAKNIAQGNLNVEIGEVKGKDEISQLLSNLKNMAGHLKTMIGNVSSGITQITNAGAELNDLSQKLSEGANSQASGAEESAAAIEEIAASIRETAGNAKTTEVTAQKIAGEIHKGQQAVANTLSKMQEISEKINIVNELASQTNILALNAAVEAARAGENGKGFAAIAAEVRKLAEKSNLAALEINELAVQSVNVATESSNLLLELVPQVENTAQLIKEIANANVQQDSGINQINDVINSHNEIIQETAAMSEEMAASAEELASQSEELKNAIAYFHVN